MGSSSLFCLRILVLMTLLRLPFVSSFHYKTKLIRRPTHNDNYVCVVFGLLLFCRLDLSESVFLSLLSVGVSRRESTHRIQAKNSNSKDRTKVETQDIPKTNEGTFTFPSFSSFLTLFIWRWKTFICLGFSSIHDDVSLFRHWILLHVISTVFAVSRIS